jgi:hypothetical protein
MREVHVVEDSERDRELIVELLKESWRDGVERPEPREWEYMWKLFDESALTAGDVVIADLYPTDYWQKAPTPKPVRLRSQPKDPTNIFNATIDMIARFLSKVPDEGAHLIVLTFVPNYIERDLSVPAAANKIRNILEAQSFEVLEKTKKHMDEECYRKAVAWANEVLGNG